MSYQRVLFIAAATGALITAAPWVATAQPPVNQQAQIVARVNDNHGRLVLLRRGYYNAVADQGFGFDKAVHKHNLTDSTIITAVVHNPGASGVENAAVDRWYYRGPWQHRQCTPGGECRVIAEVVVRVIVEFRDWAGDPRQGAAGVITAYCENMPRCPDWLNDLQAR